MKKFLLLLVFIATSIMYAQEQDALVFFADKEDVVISIANPITKPSSNSPFILFLLWVEILVQSIEDSHSAGAFRKLQYYAWVLISW